MNPPTRQTGEALRPDDVQYEVWQGGGWEAGADDLASAQHYMAVYGQDGPVEAVTAFTYRFPGFTAKPDLIPASDLEQVKQERDEAVRLLGRTRGSIGSPLSTEVAAFLASLEQTKGE